MQKWPGSDQGTCLCWAQRTQSRAPQRPQTPAPEAGEKTAKGKCPKEQGPSGAPCALQKSEGARRVGWNSPLGNLPLGGEERKGIGVGHSPRLSGPAIPAPAAGPHLARESRGERRQGRTPGVGAGNRAWSYNFRWPESRRAAAPRLRGPASTRPLWSGYPRESPVSGEPRRRPGAVED